MKIINLKSNKTISSKLLTVTNVKRLKKHFSPNNVEWHNSVYFYNKDNIKHFPLLDNVVLKMVNSHFNLYNIKGEKSVGLYTFTKRKRWLSVSRRVWVAKLDLKHTNDKVTINVFLYDPINNLFTTKLKSLRNILLSLKRKYNSFKKNYTFINKQYKQSVNIKNILSNNGTDHRNNELNNFIKRLINLNKIKLFKNILRYRIKMLYYKRFISLNNLRFKNTFISLLQKFVGKVYNKKVTFNIILLKNFYLNTDIMTEIIIHLCKNRNSFVPVTLANAMYSVPTPSIGNRFITRINKEKYAQKVTFKDNTLESTEDNLNYILNSYYNTTTNSDSKVLNTIKNKSIIGIRLIAAGRLTRRFTAQRAIRRVRYTGTLKNIDASFKGISTQMLRNNRKNSVHFSKAKSENRIGSFGIKGWINNI